MKIKYILIAFSAFAALSMVGCKNNNKKAQSQEAAQEPTQEEVQKMKQALADTVLAHIDAFAEEYSIAYEKSFTLTTLKLTEAEKLIKPDYFLDPKEVTNFTTKSQKVNALAIYLLEYGVRKIYDMPREDVKEVIVKLAHEVNYPYDLDKRDANMTMSERIRQEYNKCKENGDIAYFWQFQNALFAEIDYIIAQNPELFFSKITEEKWQQFINRSRQKNLAMRELAKYDEEMAAVLEMFNKNRAVASDEEKAKVFEPYDSAKQFFITNKDKLLKVRNALLQ